MDKTYVWAVLIVACFQLEQQKLVNTWKDLQDWASVNDVDLETCEMVCCC